MSRLIGERKTRKKYIKENIETEWENLDSIRSRLCIFRSDRLAI